MRYGSTIKLIKNKITIVRFSEVIIHLFFIALRIVQARNSPKTDSQERKIRVL